MEEAIEPEVKAQILLLRRCILMALYHFFVEYPYAVMEFDQLAENCKSTPKELNWNIVYLEKRGLVEVIRSSDCQPYVACAASISAAGVDLVEDRYALDKQFCPFPDKKNDRKNRKKL
jgi:hypothetical protein